jgi:cysteine desulfurase/selenocysteine lyase
METKTLLKKNEDQDFLSDRISSVRAQFPILNQDINGKPLIFLDSGATTQKPVTVIESQDFYYRCCSSNIHRGAYYLSQLGDRMVEDSRGYVQKFINASVIHEIIFTKGTTDGINLVATSFSESFLKPGDEIIVTQMEHHSNLVPWQKIAKQYGAILKFIPLTPDGDLDLDQYVKLLNSRTKFVSVVHISNALGTVNPVKEIAKLAHEVGAKVLVDGAQSIAHLAIDVQEIDCDFYVCSGHKAYGPQGIGFLYGKESLLSEMQPYQFGGDMIKEVTMEKTTYADLPNKFEAGTPNIVGIIGFAEALNFIQKVGISQIYEHEQELLAYATPKLLAIPGLRIFGTSKNKSGVISFNIEGYHHSDLAIFLDYYGIAVRNGKHCTHPIMQYFNIPGTVRATFGCYTTKHDIDCLVGGLIESMKML